MLRKETVSGPTLELLKNLMGYEAFKDFFLAGGTALALQMGHRLSIDLDLFTQKAFEVDEILPVLEESYKFRIDFRSANTLKGSINGVKVDLLAHRYSLVDSLTVTDGIRMASLKDIAAMKLNAITGNGTRLKDFVDIACLSCLLTLSQMLAAYQKKYVNSNPSLVIKSLNYYDNINFNEPLAMLSGGYDWEHIKERLDSMTLYPARTFKNM